MSPRQTAQQVLDALGGSENVRASDLSLTRLRISVEDASLVDVAQLEDVRSILGVSTLGDTTFEVVFGPAVVEEIYSSFSEIAHTDSGIAPPDANDSRPAMSVQISPGRKRSYAIQAEALAKILKELPEDDPAPEDASATSPDFQPGSATVPRLLVINGPNINMLGIREPGIYGSDSYDAVVDLCKKTASEVGFSQCRCFQSNHEGAIVDEIQAAYGTFDGIVINPAAYTHTSVAILDALKAVSIPAIEIHISAVEDREDFRQVSYPGMACFETITGLGIEGYAKAIRDMAEHLA